MLLFVLLYPFSGLTPVRLGALAYLMTAIGLFVILCILLVAGMVLRYFVRMWRVGSPRCDSCRKPFSPTWNSQQERLCPACRTTKLPAQQQRRLAAQGFVIIAILLLMLSVLLLGPVSGRMQVHLGWSAYPLIAIGLSVILFILLAGGIVLRYLVRSWRMNNPDYALGVARACAREVGKHMTFGPVSVYVFGANDATSMLKGQMEICRSRFEGLVGEHLEVGRPLRFFVFGKRNAFDGFFRWAFLYGSDVDGMYVPWSVATISLTKEFPAHRLPDLERVTRVLMSYHFLDSHRKSPSPLWVQMRIANVIACGGDEMELARLNRKVLAALSRGTWLETADLFHINPRSLIPLVRDWQDFNNFGRYSQLIAQSWSVVEFLCSEEERLERFRAFLKEPTTNAPIAEVFQRHFDYGFETVLDRWRSWVLDRAIGFHGPPPPHILDALLEGVIPIVLDHRADRLERIQAIREMGRNGYVLGADALIEVLSKDDQIPAEEVVWSLESISGLALGSDAERWMDWFNQLPEETTGVADLAQHS